MAYRNGERNQIMMFPPSIEEYISEDDPVHVYDVFVEAMDFNELGIVLDANKVGNPEYNPKAMLKLLLYGYSYGFRSSRKLERATYHNISFMWLMCGLKPDHKTIAKFRKDNKEGLKRVLKECAQLCIKLNLIEGNTLFVDGSKIRANASIKNTWDKDKCKRYLEHIDKNITNILTECDRVDNEEEKQKSLIKIREDLRNKEVLRSKVEKIIKELKEGNKKAINTIDSECVRINSIQGSHAGYSAQIVVDEKHGLIVNSDVVSENNDLNQFTNQINQANETLGKKCETACADSGYANTEELKKIDEQEIKVIVPSQRQASKKEIKEFDKEKFQYNAERNSYLCPEGNELSYRHINRYEKNKVYMITNSSVCVNCCKFGICTRSKNGRSVTWLIDEEVRKKLETQYKEPESQDIYKLRKQKVELPFGHIKRNLSVNAFLVRGLNGVKAEMSLLSSCFNISRMITILGVSGLIKHMVS